MNAFFKNRLDQTTWFVVGLSLVAIMIGLAMPIYVDLMGQQASKLLVLPALLIFGILFAYDRRMMLILILLFRAGGDLVLESTKFSLGGYQTGVGGLINAFVILLAIVLTAENYKSTPKKLLCIWLPFLAIAIYAMITAPRPGESARTLLAQISYFAMFVSAFHLIRTPADFKYCVRVVLWSSALPIIYALYQIGVGISIGLGNEYFRLQGTFSHPNIFAFYLTLLLYLAFYIFKNLAPTGSTFYRIFLCAYMLMLVGMLLLTKTRSAWISAFLGFTIYALFFERRYLLFLLFLPVLALLIPGITDRFTDLGKGNEVVLYGKLNSFAWRVYLWETALHWLPAKHYLLGEGLLAFRQYALIFFPLANEEPIGSGLGPGSHSIFVQWLFELGILGLISFLAIFYKTVRQLLLLWRYDHLASLTLLVTLANYLIVGFSDNLADYLTFNWYFWFIMGAGTVLTNTYVQDKPGVNRVDR